MKATIQSLPQPVSLERGWLAVYADLFKARLTSLVLLTTLVGFYAGLRGRVDWFLLFNALTGTALVASGGAALNQLLERDHDARMRRTRERPLPTGRLQPRTVLAIGIACALAGTAELVLLVNPLTGLLGAATFALYVFIYTPLKRVTWLNTVVGAIPGALPPVMGWAAARGEISLEALALFGIQALWQIPHFLAIAWIYRDEYAKAGFRMLPVIDAGGARTSRQALGFALALWLISLCPFWLHLAGGLYFCGALALGGAFVWFALQFARDLSVIRARRLFYASIIYLPLVLAVLVLDKAGS